MRRPRPIADDERVARLARLLDRVMERLRPVVDSVRQQYDTETAHPYRGLYISPDEAAQLAQDTPTAGEKPSSVETLARELPNWNDFEQRLGLEPFDGALMALALAPELDSKFQRLYAFVQDDVTRRHLSVELALRLLCGESESERLARWRHLAPVAPLVRYGLLRVAGEPAGATPWAAQTVRVADPLLRLCLDEPGVDPRIAAIARWYPERPANTGEFSGFEESVARTAERALDAPEGRGFLVALRATDERVQTSTAQGIATRLGMPLVEVSWRGLCSQGPGAREQLEIAIRDALLLGAAVLLRGFDATDHEPFAESAIADLHQFSGLVLVGCSNGWPRETLEGPDLTVDVPLPIGTERRRLWQDRLHRAGLIVPDPQVELLANRFHLNAHQISASVNVARHRIAQSRFEQSAGDAALEPSDDTWASLLAAVRAQRGQALDRLARKVHALARWEDLVLPEDSITQLREICERVDHRERVLDDWGFGRRSARGRGIHALFAGPSGTGKTMAAEVMANHLGLDLHRIDLSAVVSKYIGETEKNLERIFRLAVDVILFFDEADALLGRRSEVRDAHDRYANIEISYLLQRMEEYDGLSILATNLAGNIDEAFLRRVAFQVQFPFPDAALRRRVWRSTWPHELPRADDIDLDRLADRFTLSGGNIRNVVLGAAYLAAAGDGPITLEQVLRALQREYQKLGRAITLDQLRDELETKKVAA